MMIKKIIKFIWQLPQNLIALFILLVNYKTKRWFPNYYTVKHSYNSAVSLGDFIIFDEDRVVTETTLKHEQGHQKQSLYFGPLYLLVIGLFSVIGNLLHRVWKFDYYKLPWEAWADKLGGVK